MDQSVNQIKALYQPSAEAGYKNRFITDSINELAALGIVELTKQLNACIEYPFKGIKVIPTQFMSDQLEYWGFSQRDYERMSYGYKNYYGINLGATVKEHIRHFRSYPMVITYCSRVLKSKKNKGCGTHASLITGWREANGKTEILIRNSWGNSCSTCAPDLDQEDGSIWVPESRLALETEKLFSISFEFQ